MKHKTILACILSFTILFTSSSFAFADSITTTEKDSENMDIAVKTLMEHDSNVNHQLFSKSANYTNKDNSVIIPKDPTNDIILGNDKFEKIGISISSNNALSMADYKLDSVLYYERNVKYIIQAMHYENNGLQYEGVRASTIIENYKAPKCYKYNYNLPDGWKLIESEKYSDPYLNKDEKIVKETGWIYIVDENQELQAVIEPAWAKDANGNSIRTDYVVSNNSLIQYVYFNSNSAFPIIADPTTSTKPKNYKIETVFTKSFKLNNATLGLPGLGSSAAAAILKKKAKEKAEEFIIAKLGSHVIPVVNYIILGLSVYCTVQGYNGYTYTKVTVVCEKWAIYKHQGGNWVQGIGYKTKLSIAGSN